MGPSETNEISSILSLEVAQEHKGTIFHFLAHNNLEFKEVQIPPNNDQSRDDLGDGDYFIEQDDKFDECLYCFCRPCITHDRNRQLWWETDNQIDHERNSQKGKVQNIFNKFVS